jgi:predicted O-methyltransferase YrrM
VTIADRWRRARPGGDGAAPPQAFPPGAFYSPVVDAAGVLQEPDRTRIWPAVPPDPAGIDLRPHQQLELLAALGAHPFPPQPGTPGTYDPGNDQFPPHDAAVLYAMVRQLRPRRIVEVGCGWSTTVTVAAVRDGALDTLLTCIEPYPRPFLRDMAELTLREEKVEHSPLDLFTDLEAGDICFIDSSHVAKTGSDVVHLLLEVVPRLAPGVVVHVHDIFIPEDYPQGWVRSGFNWNEQYVLQALLVGNEQAHVLAMNHWLALRHPDAVRAAFGLLELDGSSVWFATGPLDPLR